MSTRPGRVHGLLAAPIVDDRGAVHRWARMGVAEWPLSGPVLPASLRPVVTASFRSEQVRRVGKVGFGVQVAALVGPPIVCAQVVGAGTARAFALGGGAGAAVLGMGAFAVGAVVVLAVLTPVLDRVMRRMWGGSIRRAFLAHRRCAACAYDLAGLPVQGDGCTVCAECGAAWRMAGGGDGGGR